MTEKQQAFESNLRINSSRSRKVLSLVAVFTLIILASVYVLIKKDTPLSLTRVNIEKETQYIETREVQITSTGFEPATILVKPGTQIIWTNLDESPHKISSEPSTLGTITSKEAITLGESFGFIFSKPGTFNYNDSFNPTKFTGTVIVK